jgi:hypothetical protein
MSEENLSAEVNTAASHDDNAAPSTVPEVEANAETSATETQDQSKKTANPVQPRINQLTSKVREASLENEALRAQIAEFEKNKAPVEVKTEVKVAPNEDDFDTSQEYHTANAQYYAEVSGDAADARVSASDNANRAATAETQRQEEVQNKKAAFEKNLDSKRANFEDFEDVAYGHNFMDLDLAEQIFEMDEGPEVAYHLGSNLDVAERIFALNPRERTRELTKLGFQVEALKPKVVSDAPDPIVPLGNAEKVKSDPDNMTADEWQAWRNNQIHG